MEDVVGKGNMLVVTETSEADTVQTMCRISVKRLGTTSILARRLHQGKYA
jgi:hypothetical protein